MATGTGSAVVVDGTILSPGGSAITVDGTQLSVGTAGLVVDGSRTIPFSELESVPTAIATSQAVLTLGGSTITALAGSRTGDTILIDGFTLSPGGSAITIDGTKISAGPDGIVIVGTQTIHLSAAQSTPTPSIALQAVLTLGGNTITAFMPSRSGEAIIVDGTTLSPGGPSITIDGTELSAGTGGLVVGGTSTVFPKTTGDGSRAIGGSSTGAPEAATATESSSTSDSAYSGGQSAVHSQGVWICVVFGLCMTLVLLGADSSR